MTRSSPTTPGQVEVHGAIDEASAALLETGALAFLRMLATQFEPIRARLLANRLARREVLRTGAGPGLLRETEATRDGAWAVRPPPEYLQDRRVELVGPPTASEVREGLNGRARAYIADFKNHTRQEWTEILAGHVAVTNAIHRPGADQDAVLGIRPRELDAEELHLVIDDQPISASLFDFGLFVFHNTQKLLSQGRGPYLHLPKIESHLEARFWNALIVFAQDEFDAPRGTIRATAQIESVLGVLEMDEILYELREHSGGLCCDPKEYVSDLASFKPPTNGNGRCADSLGAGDSISICEQMLVQVCHRRRAHALTGMRSPTRTNGHAKANGKARPSSEIRAVAEAGSDGVCVEAIQLVPLVLRIYDGLDVARHQIDRGETHDTRISASHLIPRPV